MIFKRSPTLSVESVREALRSVSDPLSGEDIVSAGRISGLAVRDGRVGFVITIPLAEKERCAALPERCKDAVMRMPGVASVTPVLTAESPHAPDAPPRARAQWNLTPVEGVRRIVAVASGKGGVGKSTATVQLALALAARGRRVGILDADIYGPSVPRMMGLARNSEVRIQRSEGKLSPLVAHGIRCMSMGFLLGDAAAVMRGPMVTKSLVQMLRGTRWGTEAEPLEVLLIDLPPGTGDVHLSMVQQVPLAHGGGGAILVTTPQDLALDDARKAADMFVKVAVPLLGVIENMSYFTDPSGNVHRLFGKGGGKKLAAEFGVPLLGEVPLLPEIQRAGDGEAVTPDNAFFSFLQLEAIALG